MSLESGIDDEEDMTKLLADKSTREVGKTIFMGLQCQPNVKYKTYCL